MLIGLLLMMMNTLGMNTVDVEQLGMELNEQINVQEARNNNIQVLQPIDIYFMYGDDEGTYWHDPSVDINNIIFVDYESLKEWNIDYDTLEYETMMIGLFDETSWELIDMISEEQLISESEEYNR